ncbi:MAG TPA: family 43 glycosylhydrolase [Armatimonadota bacterium]|jgi:sucrose-6-phosphate hydrolase SacC (GH32 family)/acetyl esterase/lipase
MKGSKDAAAPLVMKVWPGLAPGEQTSEPGKGITNDQDHITRWENVTGPELFIYQPKGKGPHPAVLVCPGGGYAILATDLEGSEIAGWLNSLGYVAAVLHYRVPNKRDGAFQDAQRALSTLRARAEEWSINPKQIGVLGFSAGAHLSARLSANYSQRAYAPVDAMDQASCRPDFTVLIYPAYLADPKTAKVSPEVLPHAGMPPIFQVQTQDDPILCAPWYARALQEAAIPNRCVIYQAGGHGYGLRMGPETPLNGWPQEAAEWLWEQTQFGQKPKPPAAAKGAIAPLHYQPAFARVGDTIPFYWKDEYHIFYLRSLEKVPWEHIVSQDLVNWTELPTALMADGDPLGPDGRHMFTGSVIERQGTFHLFYTGWNPENPKGREFVMHATSPDLIHWTKQPADLLAPDGVHYAADHDRDFRDPYLFWDEGAGEYKMALCARDAETKACVTGVAASKDLLHWEQRPAIAGGTPLPAECPDLFKIGDCWYLITSPSENVTTYRVAKSLEGPWRDGDPKEIDTPILYAAKRLWDGKRHILTGWLRDLDGSTDTGALLWGGKQSIPREMYADSEGRLWSRPVPEVVKAYRETVVDLAAEPKQSAAAGWSRKGKALVSGGSEASARVEVPADYLLQCQVKLEPSSTFTLAFRLGDKGEAYRLILRPAQQQAELKGPHYSYVRKCVVDTAKPVKIEAFLEGTVLECFVNDATALSCRPYNLKAGALGLEATGPGVEVRKLTVKARGATS